MWFFCLPSLVAILVIGFIQVQDERSVGQVVPVEIAGRLGFELPVSWDEAFRRGGGLRNRWIIDRRDFLVARILRGGRRCDQQE